MTTWFDTFARACAKAAGSAWAFLLSVVGCIVWAGSGPFFGWSDTWQLYANTATTVITFLMVFIIQNTQNRDTAEIRAMLKEIVEDLPEVDEQRARVRAAREC